MYSCESQADEPRVCVSTRGQAPIVTYRTHSNSLSDIFSKQSNTSVEIYSSNSPVIDPYSSNQSRRHRASAAGSSNNKVPLLFPQHFLPTSSSSCSNKVSDNKSVLVYGGSNRQVQQQCYHIGTLPRSLQYYSQRSNRHYPVTSKDEASILLQPLLQTSQQQQQQR